MPKLTARSERIAMVNLIRELTKTMEIAHEVIGKHRFAGMDQNPKGVTDLVGSAALRGRRFLDKLDPSSPDVDELAEEVRRQVYEGEA